MLRRTALSKAVQLAAAALMLGSAPVAAQEADGTRTIPRAFGPAWSHGGDRLALFMKGEIRSTLGVYDPATGETTPLREMRFASGVTPSWMPGDSAILTQDLTTSTEAERGRKYSNPNLLLVDIASRECTQLTSAEGMMMRHARISYDGVLLVFDGPKLGTPFTVASVRVERTERGERVETPIQVPYTGLWLLSVSGGELTLLFPGDDAMEDAPQFSPDGTYVLFSRYTDVGRGDRRSVKRNVSAYHLADKQMRLLTDDDRSHSATWSPDGTSIAYTAGERGDELWLMQADGSDPRMIKGGGLVIHDPRTVTWTPDGRFILFLSKGDIFAVPTVGVGLYALTEGADISPLYGFSLHPDADRIAFTRGLDTAVIMALDWSKVPAATP